MAPEPPDTALVGWIRRPHGVRGEVEVEPVSPVAARFRAGSRLELCPRDGSRREVEVASGRRHGDRMLVRLIGIDDRTAAEQLRGAALEVPAAALPSPPPGSFYLHELVGCRIHDRERGELGRVVSVQEDGGGLLLEVEAEGRRLLVPFVRAYLPVIDPRRGLIESELPPGLVEACESP